MPAGPASNDLSFADGSHRTARTASSTAHDAWALASRADVALANSCAHQRPGYECVVLSDCGPLVLPRVQRAALDMVKAQGASGWVSDSSRALRRAQLNAPV